MSRIDVHEIKFEKHIKKHDKKEESTEKTNLKLNNSNFSLPRAPAKPDPAITFKLDPAIYFRPPS